MINRKYLKYVDSYMGYDFYLFRPRPWRIFFVKMDNHSIFANLRFFIQSFDDVSMYYMYKEDTLIGYCYIYRGNRYQFMRQNDIYTGPYWVEHKYRGQGNAHLMLTHILNDVLSNKYERAFATVGDDNPPSCYCLEKTGYNWIRGISSMHTSILKKVCIQNNENGARIYEYKPKDV